eukprot:TRINITY_DN2002_c0_g2_i1.p1 TRINITY_DN2002_c0_g2~~TRINITY_DN2002_c0_g2_i1.p1  ORF type:complete len:673 (-),score=133.04 TRINITY_DN2002_c0_g2_i1:52-2070(-)
MLKDGPNDGRMGGTINLREIVIGDPIGDPSTSSVHFASNYATGERFALKMIQCDNTMEYQDAVGDARLFTEVQHPFIAENFGWVSKEFRSPDNDPTRRSWIVYILMELKARSLDGIINEGLSTRRRTVSPTEMPKLLFSSVVALAHAQKVGKSLHGTIKPANIIIDDDGIYKMSNVGTVSFARLAKKYERERITPDIRFWSPEALRAARENRGGRYDIYRADVFSLGLTMLQAALPYEIPRLNDPRNTDLRTEIERNINATTTAYGRAFSGVLRKMLQIDPRSRPDATNLSFNTGFLEYTGTRMQDVAYYVNNEGRQAKPKRRLVNDPESAIVNTGFSVLRSGPPGGGAAFGGGGGFGQENDFSDRLLMQPGGNNGYSYEERRLLGPYGGGGGGGSRARVVSGPSDDFSRNSRQRSYTPRRDRDNLLFEDRRGGRDFNFDDEYEPLDTTGGRSFRRDEFGGFSPNTRVGTRNDTFTGRAQGEQPRVLTTGGASQGNANANTDFNTFTQQRTVAQQQPTVLRMGSLGGQNTQGQQNSQQGQATSTTTTQVTTTTTTVPAQQQGQVRPLPPLQQPPPLQPPQTAPPTTTRVEFSTTSQTNGPQPGPAPARPAQPAPGPGPVIAGPGPVAASTTTTTTTTTREVTGQQSASTAQQSAFGQPAQPIAASQPVPARR